MTGGVFAPVYAQIGTEVRMRMRSFATPIALVAFFVVSFLWIPDPSGKAVAMSWTLPDGRIQSPVYSSAFVGFAVATLSCIFLTLGGFYLVAGSVRRDRERGVGAILAATPLSKTAYLGGKFAAHLAYLFLVSMLALTAGLGAFVAYGTGPFAPADFVVPYLLLTFPALAVVAAVAVFFDVTPGLRSRGGLVVWFFFFAFAFVTIPIELSKGKDARPGPHFSLYDPSGMVSGQWLGRQTIPAEATGISSGHITHSKPVERVPWKGVRITPAFVGARAFNLLLAAVPLLAAILIFDRFDPARGRRRLRKPGFLARLEEKFRRRGAVEVSDDAGLAAGSVKLTPVTAHPSARGAVLAEARLIWESASFIKWPLAAAALCAGILPGSIAAGVFLVLLVPLVSEAAAREELAGTRALVFSQPGVPASAVLWKTAAAALVVGLLGAPLVVRSFVASPLRGLACLAGLLFVAGAAIGLGSLTSGGKLFSGLYLAVWYAGLSGLPGADFTSTLTEHPVPAYSFIYMGVGAVFVGVAMARERLRSA